MRDFQIKKCSVYLFLSFLYTQNCIFIFAVCVSIFIVICIIPLYLVRECSCKLTLHLISVMYRQMRLCYISLNA
jgi:hypothetical protein